MKAAFFLTLASALLLLQNPIFGSLAKKIKDEKPNSSKIETKVGHKAHQARPIKLGTSGGSTTDFANGYCCSGTLGALVEDSDGSQYILSNTHVFASDTISGGNNKVSQVGDPINQPGYIDVSCQNNPLDYIATLSKWINIVPGDISLADAAIAQVLPDQVDPLGDILEIGRISSTPVDAFIGQKVKKSGRTSGLTKGQVFAIHAEVSVEYTDECAGNSYSTMFTNQILLTPGSFLQGGDSGSLMVEDIATHPRPIGLLFAGSDTTAVANPIEVVLNALGVKMVGEATKAINPKRGNVLTSQIARVRKVKEANHKILMGIPGVVGHAVGLSKSNSPIVLLLVEKISKKALQAAPKDLDGIPVEVVEVGVFKAY